MATKTTRRRLPPEIFDLPVEKMREGYYTDAYFNRTRETLLQDDRHPRVVMQVFQKKHAVLGGMDEAIAILKICSDDWDALTVHALYDGDEISPWETAMMIEGDYTLFAHLETVYLGVLARRTLISTNVRKVVEAANGKPIIFMPARHDHHRVQTGDGYAAHVAGASIGVEIGVTSDAQASWWGGRGIGTVPHSLIASYGGNTVLAATKFADHCPPESRIVVLVDFENDSVRTSLEVARALGDRLWGVRLDTSGQLVDRSLWDEMGDFDPRGVNERLVRKVRDALDRDGFERVRIVASGGFTAERIRAFEDADVPVDSYGVGSSLIRGENDFTADVVMTDGRPSAKVGRHYRPNPRLELSRVTDEVEVHPATADRWPDMVELFERRGPRGGYRNVPAYGCWCMFWRDRSLEHGTPKKRAMGRLVRSGREPGLLAYEDGSPVGWVALAPREEYAALLRSPQYRPRDDDEGIWSVVCFVVDTEARRHGVAGRLLDAAVEHACARGAAAVEAYAHSAKEDDYMGGRELYLARGFRPVRETSKRTVVRRPC